ncbi:MAG TPA: hypothetical protein VJS20_06630 [Gemmatimonadales bacterium]|nr:hypothetical protein [Gemmatimonadales bacterium]
MRPSLNRFLLLAILLPAGCTPPSSSDDAGVPAAFSSSGSLVPGFGGGIVTSNPSGGNDEATAIVVDSAFFYVAGTQRGTGTSSEVQWRIEKRDLDTGEAVLVVNSDPSASVDEPKAMATDGTHLYIVGTENTGWRVEKRLMADLSLVAGFGIGGAVTNSPLSFFSVPAAMAIDADHMYIVGKDNNEWRIESRRLDTGALETAGFGGNTGIVLSDPTPGPDEARAIAIDADFMYVAGVEGGVAWRIEKRDLKTGELDLSGFGAMTGAITIDPDAGTDEPTAIAIDGAFLYVAGFDAPGSFFDRRWRIEKRSLSTGDLETTTFGGGTGVVTSDPSLGDDQPVALILAPETNPTLLVVIGFDEDGTSERWRIEMRDLSTGELDPGFAGGGVQAEDASAGEDRPLAATAMDNQLFVAGFDSTLMDRQWRMSRWDLSNGALSPFGGLGAVTFDEVLGHATGLALDSTSLYVLGHVYRDGLGCIRLENRNRSNGALVYAEERSEPGNSLISHKIVIDDSFAYITSTYLGNYKTAFIEKRFLSNGLLDPEFGTGGVLRMDSPDDTFLNDLAVDSSNLFVIGHRYGDSQHLFLQKRFATDGSLDASFGNAGETNEPFVDAWSMALDPPHIFLALRGGDEKQWRLEKRSMSTGELEPSFGNSGVVYVMASTVQNIPFGIAILGNALYVAVFCNYSTNDPIWRLEKRNKSEGSLDESFGVSGAALSVQTSDVIFDQPGAFAMDASSAYLGGQVNSVWRIEKWHLADGSRATDFGSNGVVSMALPNSLVTGLAVSNDHLYAVGDQRGEGGESAWRIEKRLK